MKSDVDNHWMTLKLLHEHSFSQGVIYVQSARLLDEIHLWEYFQVQIWVRASPEIQEKTHIGGFNSHCTVWSVALIRFLKSFRLSTYTFTVRYPLGRSLSTTLPPTWYSLSPTLYSVNVNQFVPDIWIPGLAIQGQSKQYTRYVGTIDLQIGVRDVCDTGCHAVLRRDWAVLITAMSLTWGSALSAEVNVYPTIPWPTRQDDSCYWYRRRG